MGYGYESKTLMYVCTTTTYVVCMYYGRSRKFMSYNIIYRYYYDKHKLSKIDTDT